VTATVAVLEPGVEPPARPGRARLPRAPWSLAITGAVIGLLFSAPFAYLLVRNAEDVRAALEELGSDQVIDPLLRTLWLATTVTVACAVLGTAVAWLVVRTDLPARRVFAVAAALPLVLPSFVAALAFVSAFARGGLLEDLLGIDTQVRVQGFWAAFVVLTLISYPYVYLPVAARLAGLPRALEESARSLGRTPPAVFRTVVLPQVRGSVLAGSLLVFLYAVSEFGAVALLHYDALTRRIYSARLLDPTAARAMSLLLAVVALTVVVGERWVDSRRRRIEITATSSRPFQSRLGRWKVPATAFVSLVVGIALVVPVAVLAHWAWRGLAGTRNVLGNQADAGALVAPTLNTALLGVVSALVAVALVLPVAYLTARYRSRLGNAANAFVVAGFALPGLVIALSLVTWTLHSPVLDRLYQTFPLLVFAYVVHFGAQAMRASQVAVDGVPRRLDDAARSLGAGRVRRLRTVDLPLMLPGLAAGAGLVLLSVMKELPATLLLAPIGVETLATRIWSAAEEGFFAEAGIAALVLIALSAVLTWFLTIRRMERLEA
jgi:iron(III) transport system permease protein